MYIQVLIVCVVRACVRAAAAADDDDDDSIAAAAAKVVPEKLDMLTEYFGKLLKRYEYPSLSFLLYSTRCWKPRL